MSIGKGTWSGLILGLYIPSSCLRAAEALLTLLGLVPYLYDRMTGSFSLVVDSLGRAICGKIPVAESVGGDPGEAEL